MQSVEPRATQVRSRIGLISAHWITAQHRVHSNFVRCLISSRLNRLSHRLPRRRRQRIPSAHRPSRSESARVCLALNPHDSMHGPSTCLLIHSNMEYSQSFICSHMHHQLGSALYMEVPKRRTHSSYVRRFTSYFEDCLNAAWPRYQFC
jgi:hypothetical protein